MRKKGLITLQENARSRFIFVTLTTKSYSSFENVKTISETRKALRQKKGFEKTKTETNCRHNNFL